ncbi:GTP pyrophosphokinase [Chryseobacterium luquanense]|uniref:(P)ppGpp synthetase n=1 Tax=Chryseobacterium luquanense TaxID=2983766 RepID=A0ABT3Y0G4_9FLAO|nr:(p)ppGpp synthetase [Chryseobacterium luquanense]MCX8531625.1 (p)ppGpp synthetase [Chryseobacterium luquanense]
MTKDDLNKILTQYEEKSPLYTSFSFKVEKILRKLCKNFSIHQIVSRIKTKESLAQKVIKKNKYEKLDDITDILALRIITYFEDDISKIEELLNKEFKIDWENSTDKRNIEIDKFGYRSVHYILQLNDHKRELSEYAEYKDIKFEIQIRSILQHSWAEIEHDLGYKSFTEIPQKAKRTFYRVAALLEQADIEFTKLKKEIQDFENSISKNLKSKEKFIEINESTIIAFVKKNQLLREIENDIKKALKLTENPKFDSTYLSSNNFSSQLKNLKIFDLTQLEENLINYKHEITTRQIDYLQSLNENFNNSKIKISLIQGAPILWLINYLESK